MKYIAFLYIAIACAFLAWALITGIRSFVRKAFKEFDSHHDNH